MNLPSAPRGRHPWLQPTVPLLVLVSLLLFACGPSGAPTTSSGAPGSSAPQASKTLTMAHQSFPAMLTTLGRPTAIGTNDTERWFIFHANLTAFDINGNVIPQVAQKVPNTQDGDWKVNPDGTMEVTWKIRPGAVWQDGTPLTAADYVFGFEVVTDKKLAVPELGELLNISSVRATDEKTLVMNWKTTSIWGGHNGVVGVPAIPRHLIEDLYRAGDTVALDGTPLWGRDWVGLGPYRVSVWEEGSHIEALAFDRYALGRPKIDKLIIRFIGDINVIVANLLAGAIDVAPLGVQIKPDQVAEIQRTWNGGQAFTSPNAQRILTLQFNDPTAPWARDTRFRQAMIQSMNREQYVEALAFGQTEMGHYLAMPDEPATKLANDRGVIKYAYDPTKAQQLFNAAGWTKGADGLLRDGSGQTVPFRCCRLVTADSNDVRESLAVVDDFKSAGIAASHPIPSAPAGVSSLESRKFQAQNREGALGPFRFNERGGLAQILSPNMPTVENGWTGSNGGSWSNPTYDGLHAEMMRTLAVDPRQEIMFKLLKIGAEELPVLIMYYSPIGVAFRNGVEGITKKPHAPPLTQNTTWNIAAWDIKS